MATLVVTSLVVLVAAALVCRAYAEIDRGFIETWAGAHGLVLSDRNRAMVWWYLRNARVLRTLGVLTGLIIPYLAGLAFGLGDGPRSGSLPFIWPFAGYLLAALYAEVALARPSSESPAASLVPRHLGDYLPRRLIWAQRAIGSVTVVVGASVALVEPPVEGLGGRSRVVGVVIGLSALAWTLALEHMQGWVVQRRQPLAHDDLLAADDAIRSQSVHSLCGSGMAIQLLALSYLCVMLEPTAAPAVKWFVVVPGGFGYLGALFACLYFGHRAWRVPRPRPVVMS